LSIGGGFGDWFPGSLTLLGAVTIGALLVVLLAPVALPATPDSGGRELARRLMDRADADTLDPFVLRRDKRLLFSPDRRAVLAYRYVHGVGLATGDPAGDPDSSAGAVTSLLRTCASHGWRPAVVGVRADRLPGYAGLGLRSVYIGDEAVIDVPEFDLAGRRMRNARQAVTRSHNAGLSTTICRESALDPPLREELRDLAALARHGRREFGFSMALGDLLTGHYPDCLVIVCRDRGGRPVALQRYLPCRQGAALSLDAMRRLPDAPNGANERMIVDMVEWARAHRVAEVSLNFAAFRSILDPGVEHTPVQALTGRLMLLMDGRFGIQLDSLRAFNAKFAPRWVPRHLLYRAAADLPAVGLAALSAEGFLPLDGGRERPTRHEPGRRTARSTAR
jgi:lysyl-tRNA synthetase class 2